MRFKVFLCVRAYKCTYVRREMNKLALYTNGIYESENVPDRLENFQGGCSILYTELRWWGQLLYKETASKSNGNKHYKNVPQKLLLPFHPK